MSQHIGRLEDDARDATAGIASYKARAIWEYINALKTTIARQERELSDLGDQIVALSPKPIARYGCDQCGCKQYDGTQTVTHQWTRCSCGHIAQDHNQEIAQ